MNCTLAIPKIQVLTINDLSGYNFSTNASIAIGYITFNPIPLNIFNIIKNQKGKYEIKNAYKSKAKKPINVVYLIILS